MSNFWRLSIIILLCTVFFPMFFFMGDYSLSDLSIQIISLVRESHKNNIGNTVTFIYLIERATDTIFEALIVIVTALSMEYLRRSR